MNTRRDILRSAFCPPYTIVMCSDRPFGRGENTWRLGAVSGGLFREPIA